MDLGGFALVVYVNFRRVLCGYKTLKKVGVS